MGTYWARQCELASPQIDRAKDCQADAFLTADLTDRDDHSGVLISVADGMGSLSDCKIIQFSAWSAAPKACIEALLNEVKEANWPKQDRYNNWNRSSDDHPLHPAATTHAHRSVYR